MARRHGQQRPRCGRSVVLFAVVVAACLSPASALVKTGTADMPGLDIAHLVADELPGKPLLAHPIGSFMFDAMDTRGAHTAALAVSKLNATTVTGEVAAGATTSPLDEVVKALDATVLAASFSPLLLGSGESVTFMQQRSVNVSVFEDSDELREFMTSRTYRAAMTPASCRAMVAKAKFTRSIPLDLPETLFLQVILQPAPPKRWHLVMTVCGSADDHQSPELSGLTSAGVSYRAIFVNNGGFFRQQFGVDVQGLLETHIVLLACASLGLLYTIYLAATTRMWEEDEAVELQRKPTGRSHRVKGDSGRSLQMKEQPGTRWRRTVAAYLAVAACVALLVVAISFSLAYGVELGETGVGASWLQTLGDATFATVLILFSAVLVAVGHGWGLSLHGSLGSVTLVLLSVLASATVLAYAVLLLWEEIDGTETSFYLLLHSLPGMAVAVLHCLFALWFLIATNRQYEGLGKVVAALDAERPVKDSSEDDDSTKGLVSVAIGSSPARRAAEPSERLEQVLMMLHVRRRTLRLLAGIVTTWFAAMVVAIGASILLDAWLSYRVVVIITKCCSVLMVLAVGYVLEPRLQNVDRERQRQRRRQKQKSGCWHDCVQRCRERQAATRRRAQQLKRVGQDVHVPVETAPVQSIPKEQSDVFNARSMARLDLSMSTINSSGAVSKRDIDDMESGRLQRHTSRGGGRLGRHDSKLKRHDSKLKRHDSKLKRHDSKLKRHNSKSERRGRSRSTTESGGRSRDRRDDGRSRSVSSRAHGDDLFDDASTESSGDERHRDRRSRSRSRSRSRARRSRTDDHDSGGSDSGSGRRSKHGRDSGDDGHDDSQNPFAVNSGRGAEGLRHHPGMRSVSAGEMGSGRLEADPLDSGMKRSNSASGSNRFAAAVTMVRPTAFGLSGRKTEDFDINNFLKRYASRRDGNTVAGAGAGSGAGAGASTASGSGTGNTFGRTPTRHTFASTPGSATSKDGGGMRPPTHPSGTPVRPGFGAGDAAGAQASSFGSPGVTAGGGIRASPGQAGASGGSGTASSRFRAGLRQTSALSMRPRLTT